MATSARRHTVPAGGETARSGAINDLAASINDLIPVANATERAQAIADLAAQTPPIVPTATRPVYIRQGDTGEVWEHNGTAWSPWGLRGYCYEAYISSTVLLSGVQTFYDVLALNLPAEAPAGVYDMSGAIISRSDVSTTHYKRVRWGGTELWGTNQSVEHPGGADLTRPFGFRVVHSGGAVSVNLALQINAGSLGSTPWPRAQPGTFIRASWLGRA